MAQARRFLFNLDFGSDAAPAPAATPEARAPQAPPESPPPDPALLLQARNEGHAAGLAEGMARGRAEAEALEAKETSRLLGKLVQALMRQEAERAADSDRRLAETIGVAVAMLRKAFPALAERHGLDEILALLRHYLARLSTEPRLTVHVAEGRREALEPHIAALQRDCGFEGRILLLADPGLGPADLRIEWSDGGVERDGRRLWSDFESALRQNFVPLPGETALHRINGEKGA